QGERAPGGLPVAASPQRGEWRFSRIFANRFLWIDHWNRMMRCVERTLTQVATSHSQGPEPSRLGFVNRRRSTLKTLKEMPEDQAAFQEQGEAVVASAADPDIVIIPGGPRHKSLIHVIEPGHEVHFRDGKAYKVELATNRHVEIGDFTI